MSTLHLLTHGAERSVLDLARSFPGWIVGRPVSSVPRTVFRSHRKLSQRGSFAGPTNVSTGRAPSDDVHTDVLKPDSYARVVVTAGRPGGDRHPDPTGEVASLRASGPGTRVSVHGDRFRKRPARAVVGIEGPHPVLAVAHGHQPGSDRQAESRVARWDHGDGVCVPRAVLLSSRTEIPQRSVLSLIP